MVNSTLTDKQKQYIDENYDIKALWKIALNLNVSIGVVRYYCVENKLNYFNQRIRYIQCEGKTFSEKELEILELVAKALNNEEIADELGVSVSTVKTHLGYLYKTLEFRNEKNYDNATRRLKLAYWYLENVRKINIWE